ncbi:feruloyl-CoA synthase [Aurantivibrio infirmus]
MSSVREINMGNLSAVSEMREDGCEIISCVTELQQYPTTMLSRLTHWAAEKPEQIFLAKRDPKNNDQWQTLTYLQAWNKVRHIASALAERDLSQDRPIAILSGNDINHALLALAAMYIGVPFAPISPQYSLVSTDYSKLKYCLNLITPGLVFVDKGELYKNALLAVVSEETEILVTESPLAESRCTLFSELENTEVDSKVDEVHASVTSETIAKFLFSSGSTGMPKAIINTHKMLVANQQMILQALPTLADPAPVLVDWLPWNHTFGGNHNFGIVLYNGGTLYIDDGKPTPKGFLESIKNLKEIAPTAFYNVPKGFEELVKHLKADEQLREKFFSRVNMLFYAGAGLSQPVWDALEELALATCGERIMIVTGLGCTETAPSAMFTTGDGGFAGWLGLPVPGVEAKLVKVGSKTEIRFRGDSVTPGYWREPELTAKAKDEEGFFCTGDAVKFVDENDLQRGFRFDGRISEDFKLDTGTWVSAGPLRAKFLDHFGPLVKDVVIAGRDRSFVSALVFPDLDSCRMLSSKLAHCSDTEICSSAVIKEEFKKMLSEFSKQATGSSNLIKKILLLADPPSLDAHEITDKGSLNASAIQENRKNDIELLYQVGKKNDFSVEI